MHCPIAFDFSPETETEQNQKIKGEEMQGYQSDPSFHSFSSSSGSLCPESVTGYPLSYASRNPCVQCTLGILDSNSNSCHYTIKVFLLLYAQIGSGAYQCMLYSRLPSPSRLPSRPLLANLGVGA